MREDIAGPQGASSRPMWETLEGMVREKAQEFIHIPLRHLPIASRRGDLECTFYLHVPLQAPVSKGAPFSRTSWKRPQLDCRSSTEVVGPYSVSHALLWS